MFESLKHVKAWIPIDGTYDLGEGPRMAPETQEKAYPFSRCITCGNCLAEMNRAAWKQALLGWLIG